MFQTLTSYRCDLDYASPSVIYNLFNDPYRNLGILFRNSLATVSRVCIYGSRKK